MKKTALVMALLALLTGTALVVTPGCSKQQISDAIKKNKELILKTVQIASSRGSEEGLKAWAKKKPELAGETATLLSSNLDSVLTYLDGGTLGSSQAVQEFLDSTLLKDIPDEVQTAILAASAVLDLYLPIPDASTKLTVDQVDYLKAFVKGLKQGVDNFNSRALSKKWLN